jgi:murein DD-endopeptidase MepM/ murein hydrolase activator NlpD
MESLIHAVARSALPVAVAGLAGLLAACGGVSSASRLEPTPITVEPLIAYHPPVRTEVETGDTIESVSRRLAGDGWMAWRDALLTELDPRRLIPGTLFEGTCSPDGELEDLRVVLDRRTELRLARRGEDIAVARVERPVTSEVQRLKGPVTTSLFAAVEQAGGQPELAVRMAEVFQWDMDFMRDVRVGDEFVAVVERRDVDGTFYDYGTLYAARYVNDGRVLNAVAYPDENGRVGYYDLEGRPLRKQFLRSPLKLSRITSRFSMSRFHPVLKKRMPHYGIDYGAPVGTPVHVTADGRVTLVGRNGGAGRMVRVRHPNGYETNYLHLSRYGPGVSTGVRVAQGDVIGYVGSSGLSTAPHLDYRVKLNGRWINPLSISSPPAEPLSTERLKRFLSHAVAILTVLQGHDPPAGAQC